MLTNKNISNKRECNISRRKFLQGGAVLGAAVGLSSLTGGKVTEETVVAIGKKKLDSFPHEFNEDFKRYNPQNIAMSRLLNDPELRPLLEGLPGYQNNVNDSQPGYTSLDEALWKGAGSINYDFGGSTGTQLNSPLYPWHKEPSPHKYEFASKEDATKAIKRAAKFYGASLVGITQYDIKWEYDPVGMIMETEGGLGVTNGKPTFLTDDDLPFKPKSVIVMAYEMNYEGMSTAPSSIEESTTLNIYSNMAVTNYKLSTFIRELGYKAYGVGNEIALSVPYAIAAGLGEQGRQGLLITYEYGPRVRINKIFTEMELVYDKPIKFGANDFCKVCKKCAYSCPSQSIPFEDEMTWVGENPTISNMLGIKKYHVNTETCAAYWHKCGNDCGVCIASCPFNKPDFWHHRITTAMTGTPLKPFLNEMDDIFGYGNIFDEQACIDFWDLENYPK